MATKASTARHDKSTDEIFFQNEAVSLCLLVNRRARVMRIIDFRAGPSSAKRLLVLSLAQREGMDKVCTLVERDEVATWVKLGFAKEGNIPGFYKRSDAFLLGCPVKAALPQAGAKSLSPPVSGEEHPESEVRLVAARAAPELGISPRQEHAERTLVQAKRLAKELPGRAGAPVRLAVTTEGDARLAVATALGAGRALTGFEPFGRDVERCYFTATARGGLEVHASAESQACFGNVFLELLQSPRNDAEKAATIAALGALCGLLLADGVVSCFSFSPSDDVALAVAFVHAGFRRTGLLAGHLLVGGERRDAILWSRKLANPGEE